MFLLCHDKADFSYTATEKNDQNLDPNVWLYHPVYLLSI